MDLRQLGNRIRERRERQRLRQADLAGALRVSPQAVSKWERGENAPDIAILAQLCKLLDISIEWLLEGSAPERDTFPATVFCSDLNGYARRAASLPPRDLAAWANGIYYSVTEALLRHEGVPVKYMGDGFLGFFAGSGHAQRALAAAREAQGRIDGQDLVVGLHTGEVYFGTLGHPEYARPDILGQTVNTAFLCMPWIARNCSSRIGLTESVAQELPAENLTPREKITVLGHASPLAMYEPSE